MSPIPGVYKSIIRSISDLIEEINGLNIIDGPVLYHNWESRGEEAKLPQETLIGLDGFGFDENDGRWIIRVGLTISSYLDRNLLNEIMLIGKIHERYAKNQKVPLRELVQGEVVSELVVTDFEMMPMSQSELRNYRVLGLELQRTGV